MDDAEEYFRRCCKIQRRLGEFDRHLREDGHDTIPTTVYADAISNLAVFLQNLGAVRAVVLSESTSRVTLRIAVIPCRPSPKWITTRMVGRLVPPDPLSCEFAPICWQCRIKRGTLLWRLRARCVRVKSSRVCLADHRVA